MSKGSISSQRKRGLSLVFFFVALMLWGFQNCAPAPMPQKTSTKKLASESEDPQMTPPPIPTPPNGTTGTNTTGGTVTGSTTSGTTTSSTTTTGSTTSGTTTGSTTGSSSGSTTGGTTGNPPPPSGGYCSSGGSTPVGCNEGNCRCFVELGHAIHKRLVNPNTDVNMSIINSNAGAEDPVQMLTNGGSENIPVTCRAAKYYMDGNPTWFERYFDALLHHGNIGLFGSEMFSNTYQTLTSGVIISVRKEAERRGHANLNAKASEWLKAYWSTLALMATQNPVRRSGAFQVNQSNGQSVYNEEGTSSGILGGYGLLLPGNRSYVNSRSGGVGMQYILFSMALSHGGRKYGWSVDISPGYYGGLCASIKSLGYSFDSDGKTNLNSLSPPASDFGLTNSERSRLQSFISSNGTQGLSEVVGWLSGYTVRSPLTIQRTTQGISAWFGRESARTELFIRSKGGTFAGGTLTFSDSKAVYVSRAMRENNPEVAEVWIENGQICEESSNSALPIACTPLASGNQVYKIYWPDGGHIQIK